MNLALYSGMLSKALCNLAQEFEHNDPWGMITEESGVVNVRAIAEGKINPTIYAWQQLHDTFPDKIPAP